MSLPRHPTYKASGVAWLGDVPAHWTIKRLRFVAELNPSKSEIAAIERDAEVSFLPMESIGDDGSLNLEKTRPIREVETGYTYFRDGDVTIAKITPCFENGKGALMRGLQGSIGFGTTELIVVRPKLAQTFGGYLNWIFRSPGFRKEGEASMYGAGGQKRVPDDFVRNLCWVFPPLTEQSAIANFLDRETGKIDALIAEQEKLITLLAEKRQATISHAVTRGLNPDALLKDSGVAWLGQVPAHWEVCQLKRVFASVDYGISDSLDVDGAVAVLRMGNISDGKVQLGDLKYVNDVDVSLLLKPGDLLFNRTNSIDLIGKVGLFTGSGDAAVSFASYLVRIRLVTGHIPKFFAYLMNTPGLLGDARSRAFEAIGQCNLNPTRYGQITVAIAPPEEQKTIMAYLDRETSNLDALKAEAKRAVELLKERRSALIAAAVTGKVDVRQPVELEAA